MTSCSRFMPELDDPRAGNARHRLGDVLFLAIAASLCGAETCVGFSQFAESKRGLMERILGPFEPPSHDTFSRLLRRLDHAAFAAAFAAFMAGFSRAAPGVVAIDGKALRRAYESGLAEAPPLMVSAFAAEARLTLAAIAPAPDGNEVEAALGVLNLVELSGATVTADALHCHRRMAGAIVERSAQYALCLKGNQSKLKRAAEAILAEAGPDGWIEHKALAHGRAEQRRARVVAAPHFAAEHAFPAACAIAEIVTRRGQARAHRRLFLLSEPLTAERALEVVRAHWQIENGLHWCLDVVFGEDDLRTRKDHGPANLALIKRLALNILSQINDPKASRKSRMLRCAWEDAYLFKALAHMR